ncbi:MAG: gliding motility lipoprotein GldH [Bacteroidetes bacterium]|nr:gliding motility lipoprotein GldH [Bacteroidota bacterium]
MKNGFLVLLGSCLLLFFLSSCDKARIIDENKDMPAYGWYYKNKLAIDFEIKDTNRVYNVMVNLRVGNEYPFSNLFVMLNQTSPTQKIVSERKEISIINERGIWQGKGLGNLYDFQATVMERARFKEIGLYHFEIEQNMRLDTLPHIMAAGLRVEDYALSKE